MIDLHTHSRCSDGSDSPGRVVELAVEKGCGALALTDHDGLSGLAEAARRANELGIEFVRGCEVSCAFAPGTLHVLCYFVPPDGPLADRLPKLRDDRRRRNLALAARLGELGVPISLEEVTDEAGGTHVGRPHFAAVLVRHGFVSTIPEAFERYLGKGAPAYVEREHIEIAEIVERATHSGAVAVVAHPLTLGLEPQLLERELEQLRDVGVAGLECYYGAYASPVREDLVRLARRVGLVPTGGSDFHGRYKPGLEVGTGRGDLVVPDEVLDELAASRAVHPE